MNPEIRKAMRDCQYVYGRNGLEAIRPDVCNRTFTIYVGNSSDVATCAKFLRGYCYRQFHGGQMEQVLDNLICISFIRTPAAALAVIRELRKLGISGKISLEAEYVEACPVSIKAF